MKTSLITVVITSIFITGSSALGFVKKDGLSVMQLDFSKREVSDHAGRIKRTPVNELVAYSQVNINSYCDIPSLLMETAE